MSFPTIPSASVQRGILLGCQATPQASPDGTIALSSGQQLYDNSVLVFGGNSSYSILGAHPADPSLPRWDRVWLDASTALNTTVGTPTAADDNGQVVKPLLPSNANPLCDVFVPAAATAITQTLIHETRQMINYPAVAQALSYTFVPGSHSLADPGAGAFMFDLPDLGLAHIYVSYTTPTTTRNAKNWMINLTNAYLLISARSDPGMWLMLKVTGFTDHSTYCDLACTFVGAWTTALNPILVFTTVALDSVLQFAGAVPPAAAPGWTKISKTAATSRTSTTALTADPDLQFAMAANTNYIVRGFLRYDGGSATPGFKFDLDGPASPTRVFTALWDVAAGATPGTPAFIPIQEAFDVATTLATVAGNHPGGVFFESIIENGANAGTWSVRWAQSVSNAGAVVLRPGSYIEYSTS